MPTHRILLFAAATDIVGADNCTLELPVGGNVGDLRQALLSAYPAFAELAAFAVARNEEYAADDELVATGDTLVIIPPVSGG